MKNPSKVLEKAWMMIAKLVFYLDAYLWSLSSKRASSMREVLDLFYYDFLRLKREDVEVVKISDRELITRSRNPCPILWFSQKLGIDTRESCKFVSEPVCKFALSRINSSLAFERNYNHIRPHQDSCEERIFLKE